jgi:hypothetical protein
MTLKPWWKIAKPHKDIRDGKFDESIFAADLSDVVNNEGPIDYRDPEIFFRRTYLTQGLKNLVGSVMQRLSGAGKGEGVIQLQTPFGGGKTHSLLALYHTLKNKDKVSHVDVVKQILKENNLKEIPDAKIAVFVGTHVDPIKGKTPWGEIAHQLGCYDLVKEHDKNKVSPGKGNITKILKQSQPVLILIDELLEYVAKASGVTVGEGTLKGQIVNAFIQELTDAVASLDNCVLVISLPSSTLEYDEVAVQALMKLQKVSGRRETIYTPVEGIEVYEIIRKRLFEDIGDIEGHKLVADEYFNLYQSLGEDIPSEAREVQYRDKIKKSYPFHPELIDTLLERWGTITTFQRTRGVLRLLAEVIGDLYKKEDPSPLIQPSQVNLSKTSIRREFIKHIGNEFESMVVADIEGDSATAPRIDREMGTEYLQFKVATSLATAIFLYSFSGSEKKGVSLQRLRLSFLRPDVPPAIVGDAIRRLEEELWFLYFDKALYYFLNQPNLNRVIIDREELIKDEEIEDEIKAAIEKALTSEFEVYFWPKANSDIPDTRKIKLIILSPFYLSGGTAANDFMQDVLTKYSSGFRIYKNTLLFLLPDQNEYDVLRKSLRRYLALTSIKADKNFVKNLSEENKKSLEEKLKYAESAIPLKILSAYRHLAKSGKGGIDHYDLGIPTIGEKVSITKRVKEYLKDQGKLYDKIGPKYILDKTMAKEDEKKNVYEIWETFLKFTELPILEHEDVLRSALVEGVRNKTFGILKGDALSYGEDIFDISFDEETFLARKELCERLQAEKQAAAGVTGPELPGVVGSESGQPTGITEGPATTLFPEEKKTGKCKKIRVKVKVPWDKLSNFMQGVIRPLQQEGSTFSLEIDLCAESEDGINKNTLDLRVKETLHQIGAEIIEWEEV